MSNLKKFAVVAGIIIVVVIVVYFVKKNQANKPYKILDPIVLSDGSVSFPTLAADEKKIFFYNSISNKLQQIDLQNNETTDILDELLAGVYDISWSPAKDQAIISTSEKSGETDYIKTIYNFSLSEKKLLPLSTSKLENIVWSPAGDQIAYSFPIDNDNIDISIAKPDGSNWKNISQIKTLGAPITIRWVNDQLKIFKPYFNPPESFNLTDQDKKSALSTIDLSDNSKREADLPNVVDLKYSPDNQQYVYVQEDSQTNAFFIVGSDGEHTINLPLDSLNSTAWSSDSQVLYDIANNEIANSTTSLILYQIKISDYSTSKIKEFSLPAQKSSSYFIDHLMVNKNGDYLFFTRQNTLYSWRIK